MEEISFTDQLKNYELDYWNNHRSNTNNRSSIMKKLFDGHIVEGKVVADVGCGPHCGILGEINFEKMYAVDPLWSIYKKQGLSRIMNGVECIESSAENFKLPEKADAIFSFNALDHSGSLIASFHNIMNNLNLTGLFYFHIHLRTEKQLNAGHRMIITEDDINNILIPYRVLYTKIFDICPLDNKDYRSYVSIIGHRI